ncbi:hypothetical protein [Leeuwenhoekiella nanhaiensis]|uniref:Uncharacterized protein n=1 Tax=Leeuwenhoekiella nanhaiensis TaxID=1655491 RepID=A0A2G1VT48_9FLAO|nr:hypothetical protein [Leeuwenhoekiella nanhaiensis]PHQ29958.1 hypothetical protein CJ305_08305 [Leeuwenhoekiella nanhaiensis]
MKLILLIGFLTLPFTQISAQTEKPDELLLQTSAPKDTWNDFSKKTALKELKMQVEYALTRRDADYYVFMVDGQHLPLASFKDYKKSILDQAKNIHFVKSIDSIMGYPSPRNRTLVLITTQD